MIGRVRRVPSPALVISVIALVVAIGGGTFAIASSDSKQDKKIAKKVVNKLAPSLSVKHATTADRARPRPPPPGQIQRATPTRSEAPPPGPMNRGLSGRWLTKKETSSRSRAESRSTPNTPQEASTTSASVGAWPTGRSRSFHTMGMVVSRATQAQPCAVATASPVVSIAPSTERTTRTISSSGCRAAPGPMRRLAST